MGTHKGYVQIWDAAGGRKLTTLEGHSARVGQSRPLELPRKRLLIISGANSGQPVIILSSGSET